jgi:LmbE family N-acetylglucosaminyl deacetylase
MSNQQPRTLMAVHAHPDDESSSTGGILAKYGDAGFRTVVVTCTNGEWGDAPGGIKPGEAGHDPGEVAAIRLAELEEAGRILNVTDLELLGYHDSGMDEWAYKNDPQAFCNIPLDESVGRLASLFEKYRPDVVVTYDDNGGYNHPDHLQAHRITIAAVEQTDIPAKLYLTAWRRGNFQKMRDRMIELGMDVPEMPEPDAETIKRMEETEARITTTIDTRPVVARKRDALAAHSSQLQESWFSKMPEELFAEVFGQENFIRLRDTTGAAVPESDLFAGLD